MLKNISYVAVLGSFVAALIGFVSIIQDNRIFITSRAWLFVAALGFLTAIYFILLSIDGHLERTPNA
ncbi:MAG TPA: hypothetical protein VGK99_13615 [Acidobacteriota bacterium]|jgi:hypothetical protein